MIRHHYIARIANLRTNLVKEGFDAFISNDAVDNAYLTGFCGTTSSLLVTPDVARLIVDFRYIDQARTQAQGVQVILGAGSLDARLAEHLESLKPEHVAFEPDAMLVGRRDDIAAGYGGTLQSHRGICRRLREIKDTTELECIRAASALAEDALEAMFEQLRPGVSERDMAGMLEYEFRRRGAQRAAFDTIILFGENSALPHGMPGDRLLQAGDIVLVDCGCMLDGYCSDLTRTFIFGRIPGDWFVDVYETVRAAQAAAAAAVIDGVAARDVDAAARSHIAGAGYAEHFGHGTGHGVGLEVHESPRLNELSNATLEAGMVITVEPGIYLPGKGGVRIEDLLVVAAAGNDMITMLPRELRIR